MTSLSRCFLPDKDRFQSRDPTVQSMLACLKTARDKDISFHVVGIPIVLSQPIQYTRQGKC